MNLLFVKLRVGLAFHVFINLRELKNRRAIKCLKGGINAKSYDSTSFLVNSLIH